LSPPDLSQALSFDDNGLIIAAAVDAQGIAIVRAILAADELREGKLMRVFELSLRQRLGYYIVCPQATADRPHIKTIRRWLRGEAGAGARSRRPRPGGAGPGGARRAGPPGGPPARRPPPLSSSSPAAKIRRPASPGRSTVSPASRPSPSTTASATASSSIAAC